MYPLLNHFECWTFSVIQCHIRICFQTCLNKRVADEFFCRRNAGQAHLIYAGNFDVLHSFDIICNADNVQTWPTSIMWQGTSTSDLSSEKDFDLISAIDLRIWKGRRFENTLKSDRNLRWWCQWTPIWRVDVDSRLDVDLSLSYISDKTYMIFYLFYLFIQHLLGQSQFSLERIFIIFQFFYGFLHLFLFNCKTIYKNNNFTKVTKLCWYKKIYRNIESNTGKSTR